MKYPECENTGWALTNCDLHEEVGCEECLRFEIKSLQSKLKSAEERVVGDKSKYYELIGVVENKYPNETRHETALRFIKEGQKGCDKPKAPKPSEDKFGPNSCSERVQMNIEHKNKP